MPEPTVTLRVPPRFYEDHRARDCGETGVVLREATRYVRVALDQEAYDDLLSDARYYGWDLGEGHSVDGGLISSAQATYRKLKKTPRPGGEKEVVRIWDPWSGTWKES